MAFGLTWTVKFGDVTGLATISSFVLDLVIDSSAEIGQCGRSTCSVTLNNTGGQFTPNGSGTYGSTDWFSKALVVEVATPGSNDIAFVGMIDSIEVNHVSAKESTVTITGVDILTFAGRSPAFTPSTTGSSLKIDDWIDGVFDDFGGIPGRQAILMPKLGSGNRSVVASFAVTSTGNQTRIDTSKLTSGSRVADWLNTQVFPSGPATTFATGYGVSFGKWEWYVWHVDRDLNRTSAYATLFQLNDGSSALASGVLPFDTVRVGFIVDDLVNQSDINDNGGLSGAAVGDFTSLDLYGTKGYSATQTAVASQSDLDYVAQFWGNRYGSVRYRADSVTLNFSQVRARAVDNGFANVAFGQLCSQSSSLWNRANVTYRAPGMSSAATDRTVITRRRVMATPEDTRIELGLKSGVDNQSFELDSSTYGILDTNRLG
jgi:hypothetical protein